jgi:Arc/MetJ-type ribon-helix-helix transcriptional regulator
MRFSERIGIKPTRLELQKDSMDDALRSSIWSAIMMTTLEHTDYDSVERIVKFARLANLQFFKKPIDQTSNNAKTVTEEIRNWFFRADWNEVYDFLEYCVNFENNAGSKGKEQSETLMGLANGFLKLELSAYRVVSGQIVPLTNDEEIKSVNETVERRGKFSPASDHIQAAIRLYSDRKNPDYRNSVKESISAVEAVVRLISGNEKATLGDALKIVDQSHSLHPALREGLLKIYGYTNDESGIRHSMVDESSVDKTDAYFMLVSCSAFCNFLIERCES